MGQSKLRFFLAILVLVMASFAQAKINRIYESIQVSQELILSPHRLCHDGLFVYFANKKQCKESGVPGFDCEKNYYIAPIRSSEEIYLPENEERHITRFYHINLEYHYQEVDTETNITFVDEPRTVSPCEDRKLFVTENVTYRRATRSYEEKMLVASLIEQADKKQNQEFLILNTPIGNVGHIDALSVDDIGKTEDELNESVLKTPFCSELSSDQVWNMSGEYTGSGIRSLMPASFQKISRPLYVKRIHSVVNKETGELEKRYEFTCNRVWEI